jgi:flagellar motor component MotA
MSNGINISRITRIVLGALALGALAYALVFSGWFSNLADGRGFAFVLAAGAAMTLTSFSTGEITSAFKHLGGGGSGFIVEMETSRYLWEATARNMYLLGVLGTLIAFITGLGSNAGGITGISERMISAFLSTIYGLVLTMICLVPAMKLRSRIETMEADPAGAGPDRAASVAAGQLKFENILGYGLLLLILGWAIGAPLMSLDEGSPMNPLQVFFHLPSLLVVLGGTVILALFMGDIRLGRSLTLCFAFTGLIGALAGVIQVMMAVNARSIEDVALAMTFLLSFCFAALMGMVILGAPLEDRALKISKGSQHSNPSRIAWFVFPIFTLLFLLFTFILVLTPFKKVG